MAKKIGFEIDVNHKDVTDAKREILLLEKELKDLKKATQGNIGAQQAAAGKFAQLEGQLKKTRQRYAELQKSALGLKDTMINTPLSQIRSNFLLLAGAVTAVVATIRQLTRGWTASIDAFREQEQAIARLNAALDGNQGLTDSLVRYASELEAVTTFQDDQIVAAEALIATFVKSEDQIKALTKASADFAARQGIDLASAADQVTKAFIGESKTLGRTKIQIEGAAGSTERFESIVNKLTEAFGGQAEALAQTTTGQLQQYENRINNVQEEIGQRLLPATLRLKELQLQLAESLLPVITFLTSYADVILKILAPLGVFVLALKAQALLLPRLAGGFKALWATMLANPIGLVAGAFTGLMLIFDEFSEITGDLNKDLEKMPPVLREGVIAMRAMAEAGELATSALNALNKALDDGRNGLASIAMQARLKSNRATIGDLEQKIKDLQDEQKGLAEGSKALADNVAELSRLQERLDRALGKTTKSMKDQAAEAKKLKEDAIALAHELGNLDLELGRLRQEAIREAAEASRVHFTEVLEGLRTQFDEEGIPPPELEAVEDEWKSLGRILGELIAKGIGDADPGEQIKFSEEEKAELTANFEGAIDELADLFNAFSEIRIKQVNKVRDAEIEAIEDKEKAVLGSEEFTAKEQEAIREHFERQKEAAEKRANKRKQNIAIAQTLINSGVAGIQALANTTLPFPASLTALIPIALETLASIALIKSQTFKDGGELPRAKKGLGLTIGGKPHSQGGTEVALDGKPVAEAERDEGIYILNKKSQGMIRALSDLNVLGGGIPFSKSPRIKMAAGGALQSQTIDSERMASEIGREVARQIKQIPVINNATETFKVARRVVNIQTEATF